MSSLDEAGVEEERGSVGRERRPRFRNVLCGLSWVLCGSNEARHQTPSFLPRVPVRGDRDRLAFLPAVFLPEPRCPSDAAGLSRRGLPSSSLVLQMPAAFVFDLALRRRCRSQSQDQRKGTQGGALQGTALHLKRLAAPTRQASLIRPKAPCTAPPLIRPPQRDVHEAFRDRRRW